MGHFQAEAVKSTVFSLPSSHAETDGIPSVERKQDLVNELLPGRVTQNFNCTRRK